MPGVHIHEIVAAQLRAFESFLALLETYEAPVLIGVLL